MPGRGQMVYEPSYRLYHCGRCRTPVRLCSLCDRGNIYCFQGCAAIRRTESLRRARRKYQATPKGRAKNAARQCRHRRRRPGVTDQGSPPPKGSPTLAAPAPLCVSERSKEVERVATPSTKPTRAPKGLTAKPDKALQLVACDACGRLCLPYVRVDFQRCRRRVVLRRHGLR
jgi:hypothetical protein